MEIQDHLDVSPEELFGTRVLMQTPGTRMPEHLAEQYRDRWNKVKVRQQHVSAVEAEVKGILAGKERYEALVKKHKLATPWWVVGLLHAMECSCSFSNHLHNGDSLKARTTNKPSGRPVGGQPPFVWDESAIDALTMPGKGYLLDSDWSVASTLFKIESWNGLGYQKYHSDVPSPFLWSFTDYYTAGKYDADGHWNPTLVSKQAGVVPLLKCLEDKKVVSVKNGSFV